MKKKAPVLLLGLLGALLVWAAAAGGDVSDPLVSLSYLTGTFTDRVTDRVDELLEESDRALLEQAEDLPAQSNTVNESAAVWTERRLKERDVLSGSTGLSVLMLAGSANVRYSAGAVVDVSAGTVVPSGSALTANHRYLVAEDARADFTVTSQTAVVSYQGSCAFTESDAVDYNAMASALKTMHLFKGSFTAYGEGFDLEKAPTRLQALIMFIRVLGEEDAALAYTGSAPFRDLAAGSDAAKYVGYAYEKGYTNGYTATEWRPAQSVNVYQYTEFMLRALGYSSTANTNLADTMERAARCGLLDGGEAAALKGLPFLRAQLVYISFRALDTPLADSGLPLADTLMEKGVFTFSDYLEGTALDSGARLG